MNLTMKTEVTCIVVYLAHGNATVETFILVNGVKITTGSARIWSKNDGFVPNYPENALTTLTSTIIGSDTKLHAQIKLKSQRLRYICHFRRIKTYFIVRKYMANQRIEFWIW